MELIRVDVLDSPFGGGRARVAARISYDGVSTGEEQYWFDLPGAYADRVDASGTPWLACLLPLAVTLGEPLRLACPVDPLLLGNVQRLMTIWNAWYPELSPVLVEADVLPRAAPAVQARVGAFYSGGVDSCFTALRPRASAEPDERAPPDDLITVWGMDVPLARPEAFGRLRQRSHSVAAALNKGFIDVATNLRCTRWRESDWSRLAHGCALAGVALTLAPPYRRILIPATGGYRDLHPWGSHPLTDPLFSTTGVEIVHDGAAFTRVDKTRLLATSDVARRALRVCWRSESDENCGTCSKCWRSMAILYLLGVLDACPTFPQPWNARDIDRIYCAHAWDHRELRDIRALALATGHPEIARSAERSMRRSRRLTRALGAARRLHPYRLLRPLSERLEHRILAEFIT